MTINCALDGPSGAGKSTIAKAVAKKLGYVYVDTGALYRSIGLYCTRKGIDVKDSAAVEGVLSEIKVELKYVNGEQTVWINGEDVSGLIRTNEISMAASAVSAIPAVRDFLLELQRSIAKANNIIMDGRDIGTVILPDAQVKIFMTASAEERANRRYKELVERGQDVNYDDILRDINQRDYNDSHRDTAPLKKAEDACELDTSNMSIEEATEAVCDIILKKTAADGGSGEISSTSGAGAYVEKSRISGARLFFYAVLRLIVRFLLKIPFNLKYENKENVPYEPCIIAPNHLTWADPVFVSAGIKIPSAYMAKESLLKNKLLAPLIRAFHAFPVKRGASDRSALNTSIEYLNRGYNLTIFPEGTRSKDGKLGKGKSGVAFISAAAKADIVPVGIIIEKRRFRRTKITIRYGRPISCLLMSGAGMSASGLRRSRDLIMDRIGALISDEQD